MSWLAHILGLDSASGPVYLFWSGFAGDIGMLGAAWAILRRHNCHVRSCWRIGRHRIDGTGHVVCARHHPAGAPRAHEIGGTR